MTMEELVDAIRVKTDTLRIINKNIDEQKGWADDTKIMRLTCNGSWVIEFTKGQVADIILAKKLEIETELGRLLEAKRAAEITMAGWLNQSAGGKDESSKG